MNLDNTDTAKQIISNIIGPKGTNPGKRLVLHGWKKITAIVGGSLATLGTIVGIATGKIDFSGLPDSTSPISVEDVSESLPNDDYRSESESEEEKEEELDDDQSFLLADKIGDRFRNARMSFNGLTIEQRRQKIAKETGATYDGPTYTVKGDKGTQTWVSKEDYEKAKEAGIADDPVGTETTKVEGNGWLAPDGSVWTSEQAYLDWINQNGKNDNNIDNSSQHKDELGGYMGADGYYHAADGELYTSKQAYVDWLNSGSKTDTTGGNTNPQKDELGGYVDPTTGLYWVNGQPYTSKQEYVNWLNSGSKTDTTGGNTNPQKDELGGYMGADGYYHAADGELYTSKQAYVDWIEGQKNSNNNGGNNQNNENGNTNNGGGNGSTTPVDQPELDELGGYMGADGYYHATDGELYTSKQDYVDWLESQKNSNNNGGNNQNNENGNTNNGGGNGSTTPVDQPELDELGGYVGADGYYHAADGEIYMSKQDYVNSLESSNETIATYSGETYSFSEEVIGGETPVDQPELDENGGYVDENGYYVVNGEYYASKEDYAILNSSSTGSLENTEENLNTTLDENGGYIEPTSGYYVVDGACYASKEDYLLIMSLTQEEPQKVKELTK